MKKIREKATIKYDFTKYYILFSKGEMVGQIPAVIMGIELEISFKDNIVKLYGNGFVLAHWDDIELIEIHTFLRRD